MSKETPKDDPRQKSDQGSHKQTDKPWKGNPEKDSATTPRLISENGTKRTRTDFAMQTEEGDVDGIGSVSNFASRRLVGHPARRGC